MKLLLSLTLIALFFTTQANASSLIFSCKKTTDLEPSSAHPGKHKIIKTNNLRRITGSGYVAKGKFITIKGRILDENCQAASNATVEIWQADYKGIEGLEADRNFTGSGKIHTNNNGEYHFKTIMPAPISKQDAPHINIAISHQKLGAIQTRIYFPAVKQNNSDKILITIPQDEVTQHIATTNNGETFIFNATYAGVEDFREF